MKRKTGIRGYVLVATSIVVFLLGGIAGICIDRYQTPFRYLQTHCDDIPVDQLIHQEFADGWYYVFFTSDKGIGCAMSRKTFLSYEMRNIIRVSLQPPYNYAFSAAADTGEYCWIDWGVIADDQILAVKAGDTYMNILSNVPGGYKICWLTGTGTENTPSEHSEIRCASQ